METHPPSSVTARLAFAVPALPFTVTGGGSAVSPDEALDVRGVRPSRRLLAFVSSPALLMRSGRSGGSCLAAELPVPPSSPGIRPSGSPPPTSCGRPLRDPFRDPSGRGSHAAASRSVHVVSHHLDGFLRTAGPERVAARFRTWGSLGFAGSLRPPLPRERRRTRTGSSPARSYPSKASPRRQPCRIAAVVASLPFVAPLPDDADPKAGATLERSLRSVPIHPTEVEQPTGHGRSRWLRTRSRVPCFARRRGTSPFGTLPGISSRMAAERRYRVAVSIAGAGDRPVEPLPHRPTLRRTPRAAVDLSTLSLPRPSRVRPGDTFTRPPRTFARGVPRWFLRPDRAPPGSRPIASSPRAAACPRRARVTSGRLRGFPPPTSPFRRPPLPADDDRFLPWAWFPSEALPPLRWFPRSPANPIPLPAQATLTSCPARTDRRRRRLSGGCAHDRRRSRPPWGFRRQRAVRIWGSGFSRGLAWAAPSVVKIGRAHV